MQSTKNLVRGLDDLPPSSLDIDTYANKKVVFSQGGQRVFTITFDDCNPIFRHGLVRRILAAYPPKA
jgi:hypothetical protein